MQTHSGKGGGLRVNIRVMVAAVAVRKDHDATCVHVTHGWAAAGAISGRNAAQAQAG